VNASPRSAGGDRHPPRFSAVNVTVAVSNYNGANVLQDCFGSIQQLTSAPGAVMMIDDGSDDGSVALVRRAFPDVRVIELGFNSKRLNVLRNRALVDSATDFVFLVDNDVTLKSDCLDRLLDGLRTLDRAAVCIPRTLYQRDPSMIYQDGQVLHYVGTSLAWHRNVPVRDVDDRPRVTIGWGVQLIDKQQAGIMGSFNEEYVMGWGDDGEFNHKMNLAGRFCYHVPTAVVYHKRVTGAQRYYGTVRNRWRFLLECYQAKTLVLCAPALAIYEASVILFLLKKGQFHQYRRAMRYVAANLGSIRRVRAHIQSERQLKDRELMTSGSIFVASEYLDSGLLAFGYRVMNVCLNSYWSAIRGLL
jgi:GT2 family glycosyltransferase